MANKSRPIRWSTPSWTWRSQDCRMEKEEEAAMHPSQMGAARAPLPCNICSRQEQTWPDSSSNFSRTTSECSISWRQSHRYISPKRKAATYARSLVATRCELVSINTGRSVAKLDEIPDLATFQCWKTSFTTEVQSFSGCLTDAMLWIEEVEMAKSVDDLKTSQSIGA